jgi:Leucine-rich repeat (LRR) protein
LWKLILGNNRGLLLPGTLWSLTGLHELDVRDCGLKALPKAIEKMTGLRTLFLGGNGQLSALSTGLCSLVGLDELNVQSCGLTALP